MAIQPDMKRYPLMNNYGYPALEVVRGQGMNLYTADGTSYLDFTAGIAVCSLGHAHEAVAHAISKQAMELVHCSNLYRNPLRDELAGHLLRLSGLDKVFYCNSGTEANEAALKLARRYAWQQGAKDRTKLVSLPGGFHGRTYGALSVTKKPAYHEGYMPLLQDCETPESLEVVVDAIDEQTAACIVEVIQGEGGVRPVPADVLRAIEERCREVGALLIVDEIQTGVGRTGTFFAYEQIGLKPDIVTMAKGLANGMPVGAVVASEAVAAAFTPGSHGTTFGGNPLAMAAALVVVETIANEAFLTHVREVGEYLKNRLSEVGTDVSGSGLMLGMTVPDAGKFVDDARARGVLLAGAGAQRVRFVPPLIATIDDIDEMLRRVFS